MWQDATFVEDTFAVFKFEEIVKISINHKNLFVANTARVLLFIQLNPSFLSSLLLFLHLLNVLFICFSQFFKFLFPFVFIFNCLNFFSPPFHGFLPLLALFLPYCTLTRLFFLSLLFHHSVLFFLDQLLLLDLLKSEIFLFLDLSQLLF